MPMMNYIHRRGSTSGGPGQHFVNTQMGVGGGGVKRRMSVSRDENAGIQVMVKNKTALAKAGQNTITGKALLSAAIVSLHVFDSSQRRYSLMNNNNANNPQRQAIADVSNKYPSANHMGQKLLQRTKRLCKSNSIDIPEDEVVKSDGETIMATQERVHVKARPSKTVQIAVVKPMSGAGSRRMSKSGHYLARKPSLLPDHAGGHHGNKTSRAKLRKQSTIEDAWDMSELAETVDNLLTDEKEDITDVDARNNDPLTCPEYAGDVIQYLMNLEPKFRIHAHYLKNNPEINTKMRAVLVDWLIQVQHHLGLLQETLHLCVAMIDLFFQRRTITLAKLQLLGITCLLIAAKFEERFAPSICKLIALTDDTYKFHEVIKMELLVLKVLKFELFLPTPCIFVDRLLKVIGVEREVDAKGRFKPHKPEDRLEPLVRYLLDLTLVDGGIVHYAPSLKAASAMCFARKILLSTGSHSGGHVGPETVYESHVEEAWTSDLRFYSNYSEEDLQKCMQKYAKLLLRAEQSKYQGARDKYSSSKRFNAISLWPELTKSYVIQETASWEDM